MRRIVTLAITGLGALLIVGALGSSGLGTPTAQAEEESIRSAAVFPAVGKLHSKSNFVMLGTGFEPGQEVRVLLETTIGRGNPEPVTSDISEVLKPLPTADASGNFAARFPMGRFERVTAEGAFGISVTDSDYNVLATAPMVFCDPDGRSRAGAYKRKAPNYEKNPDDPRPAPFCAGIFEYPERPKS